MQVNWCKLEDQNSQSPAESGYGWHYHYLQCFSQSYSAQESFRACWLNLVRGAFSLLNGVGGLFLDQQDLTASGLTLAEELGGES